MSSAGNCGTCGKSCDSSEGQTCLQGTCVQRPSCKNSDATACRGESCCNSILVSGGTFPMGRSTDGTDACLATWECGQDVGDQPEHTARVRAYYLDKYEVTVSRYRAFLDAYDAWLLGGHPASDEGNFQGSPGTGWQPKWLSALAPLSFNEAYGLSSFAETDHDQTWSDAPGATDHYPVYG